MGSNINANKSKKKSSMRWAPKKKTPKKNQNVDSNRKKPSSSREPNKTLSKKSDKLKRNLNEIIMGMTATDEELEYRKSKLIEDDVVEKSLKYFRCTKCHKSYTETMNSGRPVQVHPFLGVLMCENCCDYYGDGNFSLDSEGEDKYCRWCGEGGVILGCSKCINGFCAKCIKKHFGVERLKEVKKDDDWLCFFCNPKPLWELRFLCSLAEQVSESQDTDIISSNDKAVTVDDDNGSIKEDADTSENSKNNKPSDEELIVSQEMPATVQSSQSSKGSPSQDSQVLKKTRSSTLQNRKRVEKLRSTIYVSSSDEAEDDHREAPRKRARLAAHPTADNSFSTLRSEVVAKLTKILKLVEYQTAFGTDWTSKTVPKLEDQNFLTNKEELLKQCQKIKRFLSLMTSHLVEFCNSVDAVERFLKSDSKPVKKNFHHTPTDESPFSNVLLFLNFVSNQVKTFVDKGILFQDVLEAEVYNDPNVIGIKKKGSALRHSESNSNSKKEKSKDSTPKKTRAGVIGSDSETEVSESEKNVSTPEKVKSYLKNSAENDITDILAVLESA